MSDGGASRPVAGVLWSVAAVIAFSANDSIFKFLSDSFPLYQLVFFRSVTGLAFVLILLVPMTSGYAALRTTRLGAHMLRAACLVTANLCFFLSLATLPLADAVALFFVSPPLLAVLSVVVLGEKIGPTRIGAIAVGFLGVLIVLRPGSGVFQFAALLPLIAACAYAALHILTRRIRYTESAATMVFYIQISFLAVSGAAGLAFGDGALDKFDTDTLTFLFRAWTWPDGPEALLIFASGVISTFGAFAISQAYRLAEVSVVAPFEYVAMPMAVVIGILVFAEWPDVIAACGIVLILASGLVLIWREARAEQKARISDTHAEGPLT